MKTRFFLGATLLSGACLVLAAASPVLRHAHATPQNGSQVTMHAKGSFEVQATPQPGDDSSGGVTLSRTIIDKQFHGELEGASKVQMLAAITSIKGSAGYVAMERVTGTIAGRTGSFILQHSGTMDHGTPQLSITVVPDSGSGQLTGIYGSMTIEFRDRKEFYNLAYTLPETP